MTYISKIISAIGNNNSVYPLLVRDCGIEVPTKVYKTYNQNKEDKEIAYLATRERLIDEYLTSAVWIGGIPLIGKSCNKLIKAKGYNPNINIKLINAEENLEKVNNEIAKYEPTQIPQELIKKRDKLYVQSISGNIEKFKNTKEAAAAINDLMKVKKNSDIYKTLQSSKFAAEIIIPIALMGFVIPKAIYAMTAATRKKIDKLKQPETIKTVNSDKFLRSETNKEVAFGSNMTSKICNMSTVNKMAVTDGGYAAGRIATARKKRGAIDIGFRMAGMMYLNFVAPKQIEKILSFASKKLFNLEVNLDPIILEDKIFISQIYNKTLQLPKSNAIEDILKFIDNPENSETLFVEYAKKLSKIKTLKNNIRDPRAYVDEKGIAELRDNMEIFMNEFSNIRENAQKRYKSLKIEPEKYEKKILNKIKRYVIKARAAKTFNVITNVALSSYLLASVLPDAQYLFREKVLGTKLEPDLI